MTKEAVLRLPPIIIDYISRLENKRSSSREKEALIQNLDHIQRTIAQIVEKHKGLK